MSFTILLKTKPLDLNTNINMATTTTYSLHFLLPPPLNSPRDARAHHRTIDNVHRPLLICWRGTVVP